MDAVCTFCGKSVLQEVREGENLFHLYCFVLYKRQASPFRDQKVHLTPTVGNTKGVRGPR
jgi:hypothetical protein